MLNYATFRVVFSCFQGQNEWNIRVSVHGSISVLKTLRWEKYQLYLKTKLWGQNRLIIKFSNLNVLQKGRLIQDWIFKLGSQTFFFRVCIGQPLSSDWLRVWTADWTLVLIRICAVFLSCSATFPSHDDLTSFLRYRLRKNRSKVQDVAWWLSLLHTLEAREDTDIKNHGVHTLSSLAYQQKCHIKLM